tara:strand:- start:25947 stop:28880 length:2934 start_codon:yes stop_codon:yes gene_type:complete
MPKAIFHINRRLKTGVSALAVLGSLSVATFPLTAVAAEEEELTLEEVVVTGSRIQREDLTANSPVSVLEAGTIKMTGTTNVEEFLRDIPQAVAGIGAQANNGNDGGATVDLRNLGEERTLVLVDGKRFVPFDNQGFVDLSMIPTSLIERVEVVTGGASAVYGSDAIAGVVNFIMRDDFEGLEMDAQYGISERGDGERADFSVTVGGSFAGDRGHAVLNIGYTDQKAVTQGDREFSEFALAAADFSPGGSFTTPDGVIDGTFALVPDPNGDQAVSFDQNGNLVPFAGTFNFNPFNLLQTPQKKWTATALATYDVTDNIEFYSRASFANNQVRTIIAPTGTFFFPFSLNLNNPFLSAQAVNALTDQDGDGVVDAEFDADSDGVVDPDANIDIAFGRRLPEIGTRDSIYENTAYQFVGGFTGDLSDGIVWDVFAQYGRTKRTQNFVNDVSFSKAQQGMRAITDPVTGEIVCEDPSGGCVPVNFFGAGNISEEAARFIALNLAEVNNTEQTIVGGSLTGDLPLQLPSASNPGAFAVGFEYRKESNESLPDDNLVSGNSIGFGSSTPVDANFRVWEFFAETKIPLVQDATFAESLVLDAGVRVADYQNTVGNIENSFTNWTYKIGGEWAPISDLRFRGMFQRAVRAPNLREIGLPKTPSTGDLTTDPCAGANPVGNAELTALCIATGVQPDDIGTVNGPISGQINNFLGGNPELEPEKSNTFTLGFVLQPEAVPGLSVALDYYSIEIKNVITQFAEQSVVDACYNIEKDASGEFCQRIARNPLNGSLNGGTETGVDVSLENAAFDKTQGIDLSINYGFDLNDGEMGRIDLAFTGTHVIETLTRDADFLETDDCAGLAGTTCLRPDPKWRFNQTVQWTYDALTVFLRWQYLSKVTNDTVAFGEADESDFVQPVIPAAHYFDLSASYTINDNVTVRAGINNLFDRQPTVVGNDFGGTTENSGNVYPAVYDPIGRYYFFGINTRF